MSATFSEARNEILTLLKTAWDTTGFAMQYPDKAFNQPNGRTPWARVTLRHSAGGQATLSNVDGKSRFKREGVITVQIFTPSGEGLSRSYDLAKIVADAFEGVYTAKGVWFRNTRLVESGPDGDWFQLNVNTDFIYDEIK